MTKQAKRSKKLRVKKKFVLAIKKLKQMKPKEQRLRVAMSSKEFITDLTSFLRNIRKRHDLIPKRHHKILRQHKKRLQTLINSQTSIKKKRAILSTQHKKKSGSKQYGGQRGGILPILIPIITAAIAAGGSIAATATGAAIMRA